MMRCLAAAMLALSEHGGQAARAALPKVRKIAEDREAGHRARWTAAKLVVKLEGQAR